MNSLFEKTTADTTAKILLDIKAVNFNAEMPYTFTSGRQSPVYIDCRKIISFPKERKKLMELSEIMISKKINSQNLDAIAGGETAGIPFAAWLSDRFSLPMLYVRKKPKGFGKNAQIEGDFKEGSRVLLVEDLASEGSSKINFCNALREAGAIVDHTFVIFYYDIFKDSTQILQNNGIQLHYLATWWDVLRIARDEKYFPTETLDEVEKFLKAPNDWKAS